MTSIELENDLTSPQPDAGLKHWIGNLLRERRQRREQRLTLEELARFDLHLLRDIGIEPSDVEDALNGKSSSLLFKPLRGSDRA